MSDESSQTNLPPLSSAIKQSSATRILELGTEDSSFLLEILEFGRLGIQRRVALHGDCNEAFDQDLDSAAEENTDIEFELVKHAGSEVRVK